MEIRVKEMKAIEEITIRTRASAYRFRLVDPVQGKGVLTGGRLSEEQEAIFVENDTTNGQCDAFVGPT
jgi:hypothetical protein